MGQLESIAGVKGRVRENYSWDEGDMSENYGWDEGYSEREL
jgi:hypothetical protein